MTIDLVDRTVVSEEPTVVPGLQTVLTERPVAGLLRSLLVLALAAIAILVVLPAAVGAASGF